MALKIAKALGAEVTMFTTTEEKIGEAEKRGAKGVLESDTDGLKALERAFDFILSTVPEKHKSDPFIPILKRNGTFVAVGEIGPMPGYNNQEVVMHRRSLAGSLIGSIAETQEILDFCAEKGGAPDVEVIDIQDINKAYKTIKSGFRYVINMASLKKEMAEI